MLNEVQTVILLKLIEQNGGASAAIKKLKEVEAQEKRLAKQQKNMAMTSGMFGTYEAARKSKGKLPKGGLGQFMPIGRQSTNIPFSPKNNAKYGAFSKLPANRFNYLQNAPVYGNGGGKSSLSPFDMFPPDVVNQQRNIGRLLKKKGIFDKTYNPQPVTSPTKYGAFSKLPQNRFSYLQPKPTKWEKIFGIMERKLPKGFENLRKSVFMAQMGMLGFSFSMQSLTTTIQGFLTSGLTGLADTETAIKNLAISDAFGGTNFLENLDMNEFVDASLNAKGALAGLSSILVIIAEKVFSDPANAEKIGNAISDLVLKLTDEKFISAIEKIVDAITSEGFIDSMVSAAQAIADLTSKLGEAGLLDKVLLLILACQVLMPVFALLQILLMAVGAVVVGELIVALAAVIAVIVIVIAAIQDWGKSGNFLVDVFNVLINTIIKLAEILLTIPTIIFDVIRAGIEELTGGLVKLENPFANVVNYLYDLKDLANETFGNNSSGYAYDSASHTYVEITNNYNKNVGTDYVEEVVAAQKKYYNSSY